MKSRRLTFRFLVLSVFVAGAFAVFSVQDAKADGWFCNTDWISSGQECLWLYNCEVCDEYHDIDKLNRCYAVSDATMQGCYSADAWQGFITQHDFTGDDLMILNEPNPVCAMFPQMITDCGNLETAQDIESCVMMIQQEQAKFHCP